MKSEPIFTPEEQDRLQDIMLDIFDFVYYEKYEADQFFEGMSSCISKLFRLMMDKHKEFYAKEE